MTKGKLIFLVQFFSVWKNTHLQPRSVFSEQIKVIRLLFGISNQLHVYCIYDDISKENIYSDWKTLIQIISIKTIR